MNMDEAILKAFPLLAVPASGQLPPPADNGLRYLAAKSGLWREINLPWIRVRHLVALSEVSLPYGAVEHEVSYLCTAVPVQLIREFCDEARVAAPVEIAGALVWNENTGEWRMEMRHSRSASADHVAYDEIRLQDGEHLVIDVHSHGHHEAFFSGEDDRDDKGSMKVSLVVGSLDREVGTSKMRLCMAGYNEPARLTAAGQLEVCT